MIYGYFDIYGVPYIEAHISIERLEVDGYVQLLVDTGSYSGALHPAGGELLGCRFDLLTNPHDVDGVGGSHEYYEEEAIVTFESHDGSSYRRVVDLDVAKPNPEIDDLPSILGRDIINDMRITYYRPDGLLQFDPTQGR